jgi:ankyrin repeat protein
MLLKGIKLNTNDYSPYISTSFSASCLTIACNTDNLAVVQSLLEKGADANDLQALKTAVFHTNIKIVNFLFEKCPEINSEVESKLFFNSLLRIAVNRFRNLDMIKVLIDKGCDINQKEGYQDDTHLHIAASHGDIETVKFLISLGASSSIKNKDEKTAADIARSNKYEDVAQYLENLKF